jgi:hypothetical protein
VNAAIAGLRLNNQCITGTGTTRPEDVVAWLGAVQAQDYLAAKWALALRMRKSGTNAEIDQALDEGRILRTHVMRPTWHFVTPSDICWLLELTAARTQRALAYAYRQFELDPAMRLRVLSVFEHALRDGQYLTRGELGFELARAGIAASGIRLALLAIHAESEGILSSGPRRGKELTYGLLALRVPPAPRLSRDEALAELTKRYFKSHGPATIRDFVWWSGLTAIEARRGLEINGGRHHAVDGLTYWTIGDRPSRRTRRKNIHLLPIYDEYLVAYRDLEAVPRRAGLRGTLQQALLVDGQVAGTWKGVRKTDSVVIDVVAHRRLTAPEREALAQAAARYGRFLEMPASVRRLRK